MRTNDANPRPVPSSVGEVDLRYFMEVARRRWLVIGIVTGVALLLGVAFAVLEPDEYTTQALVQKRERASPLTSMALESAGQGMMPDEMASEMELLRSRSVLGPVVELMALNLELPGHRELRSELLRGARIDPLVAPGEFRLEVGPDGTTLFDSGGGTLARASAGDSLRGPGFTLLGGDAALSGSYDLRVHPVSDALEDLREALTIAQAENTSLIRIQYTAPEADFAAAVVNTVAESYLRRAGDEARDQASRRREFLAQQLATVADSVRGAQAELAQFQEQSQVLNPSMEGESLAESVRTEEVNVRQLRYQLGALESLLAGLYGSPTDGSGLERIVTLSEEVIPGGQAVYGRVRELQDERHRLTAARYGYRESSSRVAVIDSLIARARGELVTLAEESRSLTSNRLEEALGQMASFRTQVGQLPAQATAMNRLEQNADAVLATLDLLNARYYEAQIAEAVASADVEIVDYAVPPVRPDEKSPFLPLLLAAILGLGGGAVGAVLRDTYDTTVHRADDAESATGLPLLGMIPSLGDSLPDSGRRRLVVQYGDRTGPATEAFKALPAMIRYSTPQELRVLAVCSPGPQEGKSFTAANLALAFAANGTRALLIDCDLHRPQAARMFEVPSAPGVTELLTRQAGEAECTREIAGQSLRVMPAGGRSPDPGQLLTSQRFKDVLAHAREHYSVVVLDTPPVLAVSEVLEIAHMVDGIVLVARADKTNRLALREAADRLRHIDAPLLGLILNDVTIGAADHAFGGYPFRYYSDDTAEAAAAAPTLAGDP